MARLNARAIVLAAGKGTRMKSSRPKVLHEICGRSLLWHVTRALHASGAGETIVVASPGLEDAVTALGARCVVQADPRGTGHAVSIALDALAPQSGGTLLVVYGDMPLLTPELIEATVAAAGDGALGMVTVRMPLPSNFGRIVRRGDDVEKIVEVADASPEQLAIDEMNAGVYAFDEAELRAAVPRLRNDNAQREYYLTDAIADFVGRGKRVRPVPAARYVDVLGINDRAEMAQARREMNARLCDRHMRDGVTIVDSATTYLEPELSIGRDTVIYPNTTIARLSEIGEGCTIGPNARLSNVHAGRRVAIADSVVFDTEIGDDTTIGPFAHLRGGAQLGPNVRIGNFVEVKRSRFAAGAKAAHLSYVGDAEIGERSNLGAGTITCNFDGRRKHPTAIGKDVSIGSNTSIVAPRTIGDGALTGAGSVVTRDVPAGGRVAGNPARPLPPKPEAE